METVTPVTPPTITVNGESQPNSVVENSETMVTKADVLNVVGNATIVFASPDGGEVRYTLNGKNPTLGSPVATGDVTLRYNGNGFSGDNTIVKAKSFYRGRSSAITKVELKLRNNPTENPLP